MATYLIILGLNIHVLFNGLLSLLITGNSIHFLLRENQLNLHNHCMFKISYINNNNITKCNCFLFYNVNNIISYKITPRINTGKSYEDWILLNMAVATQQTRHVFKRPYSSWRMTDLGLMESLEASWEKQALASGPHAPYVSVTQNQSRSPHMSSLAECFLTCYYYFFINNYEYQMIDWSYNWLMTNPTNAQKKLSNQFIF